MKKLLACAVAASLAAGTLAAPAWAALKAGTQAPDFSAPAVLAGKAFTFDLKAQRKKGPVVLYFYPAAFTRGCDIEAGLFASATDDFKALGATVVGATAGNTDRLAEFSTSKCQGKFANVAVGKDIIKAYDATLAMKPDWSSRTSYVIAPDGKILLAYSDLSPNEHVAKTLEAVKAWKAGKAAR